MSLMSLLDTCFSKKIQQPLVHGCCVAHLEQGVDQITFPAARSGTCANAENAFSQRNNGLAVKVVF